MDLLRTLYGVTWTQIEKGSISSNQQTFSLSKEYCESVDEAQSIYVKMLMNNGKQKSVKRLNTEIKTNMENKKQKPMTECKQSKETYNGYNEAKERFENLFPKLEKQTEKHQTSAFTKTLKDIIKVWNYLEKSQSNYVKQLRKTGYKKDATRINKENVDLEANMDEQIFLPEELLSGQEKVEPEKRKLNVLMQEKKYDEARDKFKNLNTRRDKGGKIEKENELQNIITFSEKTSNKGSNIKSRNVACCLIIFWMHLVTLVTGIGKIAVWTSIFSALSGAVVCSTSSEEFPLTEFLLTKSTTPHKIPLPTFSYFVDRYTVTINKSEITDSSQGCQLILHIEIKHLGETKSEEIGETVFTAEHPNLEYSLQKFSMSSDERNIWKERRFCFSDCLNGVKIPLLLSASTNLTEIRNIRIVPEIKNDACKTIVKQTWSLLTKMGFVFSGSFFASIVLFLIVLLKHHKKSWIKSEMDYEDGNTEKTIMIEMSNTAK